MFMQAKKIHRAAYWLWISKHLLFSVCISTKSSAHWNTVSILINYNFAP